MARQSYRASKGDSMGVFLEMVVAGQVTNDNDSDSDSDSECYSDSDHPRYWLIIYTL